MCLREEAVNAGTETMAKLQGIRDQSLVNNLQQIYDAGWSILDPIAAEELIEPDVFAELGGPYDDLNIDWRNGRDVEAIQDKRFDNCFHRDNVCGPKSWCLSCRIRLICRRLLPAQDS